MTREGASSAIRLARISKRFGDVVGVRKGDLDVAVGSVHAVVGENGAGKSTLLKVAAGIVAADDGEVWVAGELQQSYDARRAKERGVAMVQQHFALFGGLTVLENLIVGDEPVRRGRIDAAVARERARAVFDELGAALPLDASVSALGVGDKQRLEIARALYRDARVVILDEPTAVLTPLEADALYATLHRLAREGRAVVVVTHKLDEVRTHADIVTVMRRAETRGTRPVARDDDMARLAGEMVGGDPLPELTRQPRADDSLANQAPKLVVRDLTVGRALRGVSFEVRAGEIVGVAGVLGNGQSELVRVLGGILEKDDGEVVARSIEVVHEDRQTEGLVLGAWVAENLVLGELGSLSPRGVVDDGEVLARARDRIERFDVRPADPRALARALSGGNQQKIVLARALARAPEVLVAAHPTRGVDPHAARAIHEALLAAAARGTAMVVVSADLSELRLLADTILVMARGRIVRRLPPTSDDATLGAAMLAGEAASA